MMTPAAGVKLTVGQPFPEIQVERRKKNGRIITCTLSGAAFRQVQIGIVLSLPRCTNKTDKAHLSSFNEHSQTFKNLNCRIVVITSEDTTFASFLPKLVLKNSALVSDVKRNYGSKTGLKIDDYHTLTDLDYSLARSCVIVRNGIVEAVSVETNKDECTVTSAAATIEKIQEIMKK
ncbi:MAG: redoxin family protein [Rhabdochlamydiaceae bacterium]|jgi:peroxiredoxin